MPRRTVAALLAGALALAACGGSGDEAEVAATTTPDTAATTTDAPATAPTTGGDAAVEVPDELDFVAPDVRGGQVVGAELAGQDLVIWFWAPW